jgi:hypothetical protein
VAQDCTDSFGDIRGTTPNKKNNTESVGERDQASVALNSPTPKTESNRRGISIFATPIGTVPIEIALQQKRETPDASALCLSK